MADDRVHEKVKVNDDFQRSFTHTRPKPTVPPPTGRPNQAQGQNVASNKPETVKKN
ncbi:MAG: hypothetical protein HY233_05530 [Acidobacteriales bacterium]|nr:hypothetical protein [Candidatus Koribacter versatilis]MBI3645406.1 hypothetical protein [Terriglobales bacterium]